MPDLFARLMVIQDETFAASHYNTAYHVLAAALHCADDEHNLQYLLDVSALAAQQLQWIDQYAPGYEHSTACAATRGHASIYSMLGKQAQAKIVMLKHQQRKAAPVVHFWPADNAPYKP